jgi:hypothetical protein
MNARSEMHEVIAEIRGVLERRRQPIVATEELGAEWMAQAMALATLAWIYTGLILHLTPLTRQQLDATVNKLGPKYAPVEGAEIKTRFGGTN